MIQNFARNRLSRGAILILFYLLNSKSQMWEEVFEKSQKVSENGRKIESLTFSRVLNFCVKQFGRTPLFKAASHNMFYLLNPNSQVW